MPYDLLFSMSRISNLIIWVFLLFPCTITLLFSTDKGLKTNPVGWLLLAANMNDVLLLTGGTDSHQSFKYFSFSKEGRSHYICFYTDFTKRGSNSPPIYLFIFFFIIILFFSSLWHTDQCSSPHRKKEVGGEDRRRGGQRRAAHSLPIHRICFFWAKLHEWTFYTHCLHSPPAN